MVKIVRNAFSVIGWSVASCGLALAVLLPANLHATSPENHAKGEIAQPKFVSDGVELARQTMDGKLRVIATNQTDQAVTIHPKFECKSFGKIERTSRVPRPGTVWTHEESIALAPKESKQLTLPSTLAANPGDFISVTTEATKDAVVLLNAPLQAIK